MGTTPTLAAIETAIRDAIRTAVDATTNMIRVEVETLDDELFAQTAGDRMDKDGRLHFYSVAHVGGVEDESVQRWRFKSRHQFEVSAMFGTLDWSRQEEDRATFSVELEAVRSALRGVVAVFGGNESLQDSPRTVPPASIALAPAGVVTDRKTFVGEIAPLVVDATEYKLI